MEQNAKDDRDPFNTHRPVVYSLQGWRKLVFYPVAMLLWLYFRSWRFSIPEMDKKRIADHPNPRVVILWHNRSLLATEIVRRLLTPGKLASLVSPSRMAAWEVALFEFMQVRVIRGSTTRRSIQASIEILRSLRDGTDIGISPDGPSGPLYSFQSGAYALAKKAEVPILIIVPNCRSAWRLKTWDRHMIPLPFAQINVRTAIIPADDALRNLPMEQALAEIRRVCLEMTEDSF